jgi:hypothetical protein
MSTAKAHVNTHAKSRVFTARLKAESFEFHKQDVLDDEAKLSVRLDLLFSDRQVLAIKSSMEL